MGTDEFTATHSGHRLQYLKSYWFTHIYRNKQFAQHETENKTHLVDLQCLDFPSMSHMGPPTQIN